MAAKDPLSAISGSAGGGGSPGGAAMERENSLGLLPDLEKLSLEKGRPLDVEDLDDAGWRAASREDKIVELGRLGEGAGGAVTRCVLKGGKTVFALKVGLFYFISFLFFFYFFYFFYFFFFPLAVWHAEVMVLC